MRTIYIDSDFRCHVNGSSAMEAVETEFFDGKCDAYVEGYRLIPKGQSWKKDNGVVFYGEMISPWKPYTELDTFQREYERQLIQDQAATIAELDAALLDMTYQNIIGSIE